LDIGGPSMLRSAAKNHASVTVICDPADYERTLEAMGDEAAIRELRRELALKVFQRTAAYDAAISRYLEGEIAGGPPAEVLGLPARFEISLPKARSLGYGENPHQQARSEE